MTKLVKQLETIVKNDNTEELKKFFCNNYRIKTYIDLALVRTTYYHNLNVVKYILINFKNKISAYSINYALNHAIDYNNNNFNLVKYIFNNFSSKISYGNIKYALRTAAIYGYLPITKYILTNHLDKITEEDIIYILEKAVYYNNLDIAKAIKPYLFIKKHNLCPEKYKSIILIT
jgi:hypothetical protein